MHNRLQVTLVTIEILLLNVRKVAAVSFGDYQDAYIALMRIFVRVSNWSIFRCLFSRSSYRLYREHRAQTRRTCRHTVCFSVYRFRFAFLDRLRPRAKDTRFMKFFRRRKAIGGAWTFRGRLDRRLPLPRERFFNDTHPELRTRWRASYEREERIHSSVRADGHRRGSSSR